MADSDSEEDYMKMTFAEPKPTAESSVARAARLKNESMQRGIHKPKAELEREQRQKLETDLATPMTSTNKGFSMLSKMGYKKGDALGKASATSTSQPATSKASAVHNIAEPLSVDVRDGREGIGMLSERKRKFRAEAAAQGAQAKKARESEDEYRERVRAERERDRAARQAFAAQKVADQLAETEDSSESENTRNDEAVVKATPVTFRRLVMNRLEREAREKRAREEKKKLQQESSVDGQLHLGTRADDSDEEDADYKHAFGLDATSLRTSIPAGSHDDDDGGKDGEDEDEDEDEELAAFEALEPAEQLEKVVMYLREAWRYCFWCKAQYPDYKTMKDECPGPYEDLHS